MAGSSINKKVRNATLCEYKGIKFRSKLEVFCYKELLKLKVPIKYEEERIELYPKFSNQVHVFQPNRNKILAEKPCKFLPITYTPDFILEWKDKLIVVEAKGRPNDSYPLKKKMFLNYLGEIERVQQTECYFFEPHNQRQMLQCIEIIKNL